MRGRTREETRQKPPTNRKLYAKLLRRIKVHVQQKLLSADLVRRGVLLMRGVKRDRWRLKEELAKSVAATQMELT